MHLGRVQGAVCKRVTAAGGGKGPDDLLDGEVRRACSIVGLHTCRKQGRLTCMRTLDAAAVCAALNSGALCCGASGLANHRDHSDSRAATPTGVAERLKGAVSESTIT